MASVELKEVDKHRDKFGYEIHEGDIVCLMSSDRPFFVGIVKAVRRSIFDGRLMLSVLGRGDGSSFLVSADFHEVHLASSEFMKL